MTLEIQRIDKRHIGNSGPEVLPLGLGCFGMSGAYGAANDSESIATIHRALDLGCSLLDTADEYGAGSNERLVGGAIRGRRYEVVLASKFGLFWDSQGRVVGRNGRPQYVVDACEASLRRLRSDFIDLYYLHRADPSVPIEETVGAMSRLVSAGKVRAIGLCEVGTDLIHRARSVHPIAALQSEYSLWTRDLEQDVIPVCKSLGIAVIAFSPLGRGFFAGAVRDANFEQNDFRRSLPRFEKRNLKKNLVALSLLEDVARKKGCSLAQLALSWVLSRGNHVIAIPGARTTNHLEENLTALSLTLTAEDLASIEDSLSVFAYSGARYPDESPYGFRLQFSPDCT